MCLYIRAMSLEESLGNMFMVITLENACFWPKRYRYSFYFYTETLH